MSLIETPNLGISFLKKPRFSHHLDFIPIFPNPKEANKSRFDRKSVHPKNHQIGPVPLITLISTGRLVIFWINQFPKYVYSLKDGLYIKCILEQHLRGRLIFIKLLSYMKCTALPSTTPQYVSKPPPLI